MRRKIGKSLKSFSRGVGIYRDRYRLYRTIADPAQLRYRGESTARDTFAFCVITVIESRFQRESRSLGYWTEKSIVERPNCRKSFILMAHYISALEFITFNQALATIKSFPVSRVFPSGRPCDSFAFRVDSIMHARQNYRLRIIIELFIHPNSDS